MTKARNFVANTNKIIGISGKYDPATDVIGSVTIDLSNQTDALSIPKGHNTQRPSSPVSGMIRFNSQSNELEFYNGTQWLSVSTGSFDTSSLSKVATDYTISATAPSSPSNEAHWYDTTNKHVKVRDTASSNWIPLAASNNSTINYAITIQDGYNTALSGPINIDTNGSINIKGNLNII